MAIRPDYIIGTLTLVAGSKDFTTTGSALEIAAVQAGDAIITASGSVLIVASISGQNSGILFENCPASAAGSAQPLRIRYQPDGSRYQGAVRDLVQKLGNGNVDAFSGLQGVADGVPVFTGFGTMEVVPKSEFGPDDVHGNLEGLAALADIENLTELAALAKANNQFIVMGTDGKIAILPIKSLTDETAKKYTLPSSGDNTQLLDGTGQLVAKSDLPVSTEQRTAIDLKLDKTAKAADSEKLEGKAMSQLWAAMGAGSTIGNNGYFKLPNGIILQWGNDAQSGQDVSIQFPMTFPNAVWNVVAVPVYPVGNGYPTNAVYVIGTDEYTKVNFAARKRIVSGGNVSPTPDGIIIRYFAVGN